MDTDIAMGVLRLALGPMLIAHGYNKVFGPGGMGGTERWFQALGLQPAWLHARTAAATEIAVGLLLIAGLLTTFAVAGCIGLMLVAGRTDHRDKGFFVFKGGWEYVAFVALSASPLALLGPAGLLSITPSTSRLPAGSGARWRLLSAWLLAPRCSRSATGQSGRERPLESRAPRRAERICAWPGDHATRGNGVLPA
jgi:putative oxidoreductase